MWSAWADEKMLLSFGGSVNLEQAAMGPAAYQLLEEIGVDFKALQNAGGSDYALSNGAFTSSLTA